ncbi:MAG: P-II family nitrogen regulator [Clostridia bacterium]|nr:P-II family nitrogen regulator [Clostridia bacterium]
MKKIEIIIKAEKLEELKDELTNCGISGMMITNIMGFGTQKGYTPMYRGSHTAVNLLPKLKVETVVADNIAQKVIDVAVKVNKTGNMGDGKIFIYDVEDAVRVRTGETGNDAI